MRRLRLFLSTVVIEQKVKRQGQCNSRHTYAFLRSPHDADLGPFEEPILSRCGVHLENWATPVGASASRLSDSRRCPVFRWPSSWERSPERKFPQVFCYRSEPARHEIPTWNSLSPPERPGSSTGQDQARREAEHADKHVSLNQPIHSSLSLKGEAFATT